MCGGTQVPTCVCLCVCNHTHTASGTCVCACMRVFVSTLTLRKIPPCECECVCTYTHACILRAQAGGWETAPTEQVSFLHPRLQTPTHLLQASLTPRHQHFPFQTQLLLSRLLHNALLCRSFDQELEGLGHNVGSVQLRLVILLPSLSQSPSYIKRLQLLS